MKGKWFNLAWIMGLTCLILASVVVPQTALANQPYMGGYFSYSDFSTQKVLTSHRFMADEGDFPAGRWLGAVTSVAGWGNNAPSGWIYQNF